LDTAALQAPDNSVNSPLVNDPAREATASLRGYWSQIWRSVLAWIDLGESERLYLEGAEDFDRVSGLDAEAVQVKDVAGNVTLRSGDVIDAIDNLWAHQQRNPRHTIRFRFLTTAGIGVEQGSPLGAGVGGLQLWQTCRLSEDTAQREHDARAIAAFLLNEGRISIALQEFLRTATNAQIWQQIVAPLEWDTDAEETPDVIQEVKDKLVILGQNSGVPPDKSDAVAEHLYAVAYATATRQKDRYLTRAGLLRLFQERTQVSLPAAAAEALFAVLPQHLVPLGSLPVAVGGKSEAIGRPPPLPARYYARQGVFSDITARLLSYPVLVLRGGTGVGKSVAAAGYAAASTSSWAWVDLRGVSPAALPAMLDRVAAELEAESGLAHLVLDDIELPADTRPLETPLARIKSILWERGGSSIITSAVALPQRLSIALDLPAQATLSIPPLSRDEIAEFLSARGCPGPQIADSWAAFIHVHTSGHAQLVHARVATIEARGFPQPDAQELIATPSDVIEARAEARRLITALDSPTRDLIYRLSLIAESLLRRQVFAIARQPSPIPEPGLAFDRLLGPWLETVGEGRYRISPLLRSVGQEVQGEDWATEMHGCIADALLKFRTLSPTDVSAILLHALAGRNWIAVTRLSIGILKADKETWRALAQTADWFVLVGTGRAAPPEIDDFSLFLIRFLQLRLAAAGRDERGIRLVIDCVDRELPATVEGVPQRLSRYFFLGQVLLSEEADLPVDRLVSMGLEYIRLADELGDVLTHVHEREFGQELTGPDGTPDLAAIVGFALARRVANRYDLAALLQTCEPADPAAVRRILWFIGGRESNAQMILDRVWLTEGNTATPDWLACRDVLERTYALGRRVALPALAQHAAREIARLVDQNLKDPAEALRLADVMAAEIGRSPAQDDGRAAILLHKGDNAEALAIWRELLPHWAPLEEFDVRQTFSNRLAAVAAGHLGQWAEAASWLRRARDLADNVRQPAYRPGLLIDEGFARWKSGDNRGALECLADGLTVIDQLPPDDADQQAFLLRKRAGHTFMWIATKGAGGSTGDFPEPPPACCSNLESMQDTSVPSTPSDVMWEHLLQFEFVAECGTDLFNAHEARIKASPYAPVRFTFNHLRIRHRLRHMMLADFVEVVGDFVESIVVCQQHYRGNEIAAPTPLPLHPSTVNRGQFDAKPVLMMMLNAVFALAGRGAMNAQVLEQWRISAERAGFSFILTPWLNFIASLFIENTIDAAIAVRDQSVTGPWQLVASIRIAIDHATRPVDLLMIHNLWVEALQPPDNALFVLPDIEHLVTDSWQRLSEQSFLLRSPAVTVPPLRRACASTSTGWRKIGEVLAAACDTVPMMVPQEFRRRFSELA
jgi:hypothetical protein